MRYIIDHDLHSHSFISPCSRDDRQTKQALFAYAVTSGYKLMALTDHCWDTQVPCATHSWADDGASLNDLKTNLPLPQGAGCHFLFGCEADMNRDCVLGLSRGEIEKLDFIILSTAHLNLRGFTTYPEQLGDSPEKYKAFYQLRLHTLLDMDLPFHKCGLSHFTVANACPPAPIRCMELFTDSELTDIFAKVRKRGLGVELNFDPARYTPSELEVILRPYRIAKALGCKFYIGGDCHHPEKFPLVRPITERIIDLLQLEESDKFPFVAETVARLNKEAR